MIQKKICLIGAFAVGKTSLVERFVKSIFSEKYHTNIGVKIDKKSVTVGETPVNLMLWDLVGQDEFRDLEIGYLRGSAGYLLVADGTRRSTLECALDLQQRVEEAIGPVPFRLLVNKADRALEWEVTDEELDQIARRGWSVTRTSARTGEKVEEEFHTLAELMLKRT